MNFVNCAWCGSAQDSLSGNPKSCRNCGAPPNRFAVEPPPIQPAENRFFDFLEAERKQPRIGREKVGQQKSFATTELCWGVVPLFLFAAFLIAFTVAFSGAAPTSDETSTNYANLAFGIVASVLCWGALICLAAFIWTKGKSCFESTRMLAVPFARVPRDRRYAWLRTPTRIGADTPPQKMLASPPDEHSRNRLGRSRSGYTWNIQLSIENVNW